MNIFKQDNTMNRIMKNTRFIEGKRQLPNLRRILMKSKFNENNSNQPTSVGSQRLPTRELVAFTIRHAFFSDIPHPLLHTRP